MGSNSEPFNNAAYVDINNAQMTFANDIHYHHQHEATPAESKALVELSKHCAFGAFLNSIERANPPRCSPKTRVKLIGETKGWATGTGQTSSAMWMTGSAGSGKTALCQNTAEDLKKEGRVLGCHFFYRTSKDGKRSDGYCWVPSLVHQMIRVFPETIPFVEKEIRGNNSVFDQQPDSVFEDLILAPLRKAFPVAKPGFSFWKILRHFFGTKKPKTLAPRLIIIDGLDECKSPEMQVLILQTIANAIPKLPIPLRFLIASRPETHIRTKINQVFNNIPLYRINLDQDQDVRKDLEAYYHDRFDQIRRHHPALRGQEASASWPSQDDVNILVTKSSTQFIFASTVMNYISHHRNHPIKRLEVILGKMAVPRNDRPFDALDTLYTVILLSIEEADRQTVWLILTFIYLAGKGEFPELHLEASPNFLDRFLGLHSGDVARLLDPLVSLLTLPESPSGMIFMLHASFFDYLRDPDRSEELVMELGSDCHKTFQTLPNMAWWVISVYQRYVAYKSNEGDYSSVEIKAERFLYHASRATASLRLILILFSLDDDLLCQSDHQFKSPDLDVLPTPNDVRSHLQQLHDLLCSKLGSAKIVVDSDGFRSRFEEHRQCIASMIVQHAYSSTREEDLTFLISQIYSAVAQTRVPNHKSDSTKLSVQSCIPLIKELLNTKVNGSDIARKDFIHVLSSPEALEPWVHGISRDVLVFLDGLLAKKGFRPQRKRYDVNVGSVKLKWEEYSSSHGSNISTDGI